MKLKTEKNYLVFPVSEAAKKKKIEILRPDGTTVTEAELRIDTVRPEKEVYLDVRGARGLETELVITPDLSLTPRAKDRRPVCHFGEPRRPLFHLTVPEGTLTGIYSLLYLSGKYHIFYGFSYETGDKTPVALGYATGKSLCDVEFHLPPLLPDRDGRVTDCFAAVDEENLSGTRTGEQAPILLFCTYEKTEEKRLYLVTSVDGGKTFVKTREIGEGDPLLVKYSRDCPFLDKEGKSVSLKVSPLPHFCGGFGADGVCLFPQETGGEDVLPHGETLKRLEGKRLRKARRDKSFGMPLHRCFSQSIDVELDCERASLIKISLLGEDFEINGENGAVSAKDEVLLAPEAWDKKVQMTIITDTCGFEIFAYGRVAYHGAFPDASLPLLSLEADSAFTVKASASRLRAARLRDGRK